MRRGGGEAGRAPGRGGEGGIPWSGGVAKGRGGAFRVAGGREYLTGFHKRKVERRKAALEEIKRKLKEEQRKMKEEVPTHTPGPLWEKGRPPSPALPSMAGWERGRPRGRRGLQASLAPLEGGRDHPGRRAGGWSGRGASVTCFHPSAAPGVPEDAEREGGGAR